MDPIHVFDNSCGHSHVDGEFSGLEMSLDEELVIPSIVTLSIRKITNVVKTLGGDANIRKSTCAKYLVDRLRHNGFLAHHYAYMVKF